MGRFCETLLIKQQQKCQKMKMFLSCKSHNPYEKTDVTLEKAELDDIAYKIGNLYHYKSVQHIRHMITRFWV